MITTFFNYYCQLLRLMYVHCIQREQGIICGVNVFGLVIIRINANETI